MAQTRAGYLHVLKSHPDLRLDDPLIHLPLFFVKGALALDLLRERLGPEPFRRGLRRYFEAGDGDQRSLDDLAAAYREETGEELGWFFPQWWQREGHPILEVELGEAPPGAAGTQALVVVRQVQEGEAYRLRLPLLLRGASANDAHVVELRTREDRFLLDVSGAPLRVVADPEGRMPIEWRSSD